MNERVTETVDSNGNVIERTIERGTGETTVVRSGAGTTVLVAILVVVLAVAAWFLVGPGKSQAPKDDAIAAAAKDVGTAAKKTGDSIEKAIDKAVE